MELKLLQTDIALKNLTLKLENSLKEFKENTPHRKDIIESMESSLDDVYDINSMYEYLKTYYNTNEMVQYLQTIEIEKLKRDNKKLEDSLEAIKSNLSI